MSWGIVCSNKSKNFQTLQEPLCLTMVALEPSDVAENEKVSLIVSVKGEHRLLCTLVHGQLMQQLVHLKFSENEQLSFSVKGNGTLHVLGYLMRKVKNTIPFIDVSQQDSDGEDEKFGTKYLFGLDDSNDNESDESWCPSVDDFEGLFMGDMLSNAEVAKGSTNKKVKFIKNKPIQAEDSYVLPAIKSKKSDDSDDDESETEDEENTDKSSESSDDSEDAEEDNISRKRKFKSSDNQSKRLKLMESSEMKNGKSSSKKSKKALDHPDDETRKIDNEDLNSSIEKKNSPKKISMTYVKCPTPSPVSSAKGSNKKSMESKKNQVDDIEYNDLRIGRGPVAKKGKLVYVHYTGQFTDGKVFDKCVPPKKPFAFRLGRKEVIKGWDVGIEGMKVGGKRKLTIPPNMAYGKTGQGIIPPNATLAFIVELTDVRP